MHQSQPLPPTESDVFTTAAGYEAGATRGRLRSGDLDASVHGVRRASATDATFLERCRMYLERAPDHALLSHSTAALVWGAPLPWRLESDRRIHVSVPTPAARLHSRGIVGHQLDLEARDVTQWGGMPVTSPARTWLDLASMLRLDDLVAVGDYLIHHSAPFADRVDLALLLGRSDGQRAVRLAREALGLLSDRAESRPESRLRVLIATSGLPMPEVNRSIVATDTGKQLRPDFQFREQMVILEYQGDYHRTRSQWRKDMTRRSRLETQGWRVMELNADDLADPAELLRRIHLVLKR